jgi:hypothetical protein
MAEVESKSMKWGATKNEGKSKTSSSQSVDSSRRFTLHFADSTLDSTNLRREKSEIQEDFISFSKLCQVYRRIGVDIQNKRSMGMRRECCRYNEVVYESQSERN